MDKVSKYIDIEAMYRRRANDEPDKRERHIADADAWGRLADVRGLAVKQQLEIREVLAPFERSREQDPKAGT